MDGAAVVPPANPPPPSSSSYSSSSASTPHTSKARSADVPQNQPHQQPQNQPHQQPQNQPHQQPQNQTHQQHQQGQQQQGSSGGGGRGHQLPQRFRSKRDKNRQQFHGSNKRDQSSLPSGGGGCMTREEMNLNNLLSNVRHGLPIPFPMSPPGLMGTPGGHLGLGGGGGGGMFMFPGPNGHVMTKIGPYKEPLLPSGPPPFLLHHGALNFTPLAFAHHANVKAAVQAMEMFSPGRKDPGMKFPLPHLHPESHKPPAYPAIDVHKARIHSRSESASHLMGGGGGGANSRSTSTSSVGNMGAMHDPSLKKLTKDLHRCEVSIARYQTMLNEHCDAGLRFLHQAFITLHIGLNAREKDIARELQMTRETASTILLHRHTTACVLRQLAERAGELDETQLHELKKQIKQFVVDRKVDEEIGTTSRLIADPDELLPHVRNFGKVVNRRHVYTSWEGDPAAAVEKSKHSKTNNGSRSSATSVFSSPPSSLPTTPSPIHSHSHSHESTTVVETKSNERGSHGNGRSDDSVFEGESPAKTAGERDAAGEGDSERGREEEGEEVGGCGGGECEGDCVREEKSEGVSVKCSTGEDTAPPTYPSPSRVLREEDEEKKETHSVGTTEDTLNSHQNNAPSSSSSSATSSNHQTTGADSISTVTTTAVPNSVKTPPNAGVTAAPPHKNRQSFSRRFATPIVVTHARRSFPKSLPKNLDPKSTVTLLLCSSPSSSSSSDKKHGKHGGNKHHKSNFSSRPKFKPSHHSSPGEGVAQEEAGPGLRDSAPSLVVQRLKGREKEREMWKKRFGNSPVTNGSSGDVGCEVVEVCRDESGEEGGGVRAKKSPEEMSAIQSRVRESLQAQGVFLYDPVTGAIPADVKRGDSVDSGLGKSETHPDHPPSSRGTLDKKKTPTQLRRERKKRQKERERRQREMEGRRSREGEKGRERTLLLTSTSTSRTTSPLSSLENTISSAEDTPTESLSLSQTPPPPPPPPHSDHTEPRPPTGRGEEGDEIDRMSDVMPGGGQLGPSSRSTPDDSNALSDKGLEDGGLAVSGTIAGNEGDSPTLSSSDSASIEWEMSRQQRRQERVKSLNKSPIPRHQRRSHSTGNNFTANGRDALTRAQSPPPSPGLPHNGTTHCSHTHSRHRAPPTTHSPQHIVTTVTKPTPSTTLSINHSNDRTRPSSHSSPPPTSPPPSLPHSVVRSPLRNLKDVKCPGKLQRNGSEESVLILNGHEE